MDMEKATLRTSKSITRKKKLVFLVIMMLMVLHQRLCLENILLELKLPYEIYIPDRKKEGYGPSIKSFKELINKGVKIIFTVDCGTLSFDAIEFAKDNNTDVIVLDHHQSEIKLPKAFQ